QEVESDALGGEQGSCVPLHVCQHRAGRHAVAVCRAGLPLELGVQQPEGGEGDLQPGHNQLLLRQQNGTGAGIRRDRGLAGDVAFADVLVERLPDDTPHQARDQHRGYSPPSSRRVCSIFASRASSSAMRARVSATTSGLARSTKLGLASFLPWVSSSACTLLPSLFRRARSAAMSNRPAIGRYRSQAPTGCLIVCAVSAGGEASSSSWARATLWIQA